MLEITTARACDPVGDKKTSLSLPSALGPPLLHRFGEPLSTFRRQPSAPLALLSAWSRGLSLSAPLSRSPSCRSQQRGDRFADTLSLAPQICHDSIYFQRSLLCCDFHFVAVSQRIVSGLQFHLSISLAEAGSYTYLSILMRTTQVCESNSPRLSPI